MLVAEQNYQWISYRQSLYQNIIKIENFVVFLNNFKIGKYVWKHEEKHSSISLSYKLSSPPTC